MDTVDAIALLAVVGVGTASHAASWGAYKDTPFEGFRWRSVVRTLLIGTLGAVLTGILAPSTALAPVLVVVGLLYTLERLTTEAWKVFLRNDDQRRYTIPMRLAFRGRPVDSRGVRYGVGSSVVVLTLAACWLLDRAQETLPVPGPVVTVLLGGVGGWLIACGGALKDAPIEGFSPWKFMRSPVVATAWAWPLSYLSGSWIVVVLSAGGLSVATIETYKTFLTGGRAPGKFAGKPADHDPAWVLVGASLVHMVAWVGLAAVLSVGAFAALEGAGGWTSLRLGLVLGAVAVLAHTMWVVCARSLVVAVRRRSAPLPTASSPTRTEPR